MDEQGLLPDHLMLHAVVRALAGSASQSQSASNSGTANAAGVGAQPKGIVYYVM